jgi:hypothetical protein
MVHYIDLLKVKRGFEARRAPSPPNRLSAIRPATALNCSARTIFRDLAVLWLN